jgi:glucan 1,4-alpha-glucosidase
MKALIVIAFLCIATFVHAQQISITSPNKNMVLQLQYTNTTAATYTVVFKNNIIIAPSNTLLHLKNIMNYSTPQKLLRVDSTTVNETWQQVWGEEKEVLNHYNEITLTYEAQIEKPIQWQVIYRVYNEGVGLRYHIPQQKNINHIIVSGEKTEFSLTNNYKAWWLPGDYDSNEYPPYTSLLTDIDAEIAGKQNEIHGRTLIDKNTVQTPLMLQHQSIFANIHEANLVNYPAMHLTLNKTSLQCTSTLVPDVVGNYAYVQAPFKSPWRVINIADKATDILASRLILNLNEPNAIKDVSFIKPMKYIGVWWEMHVGKSTWDYSGLQNATSQQAGAAPLPSGKHGATTANTKRYIDFAAKHGFGGILVEGWNTGWEDWFGKWKENVFDFVTPYPDFDVAELSNYAKQKGVALIMHHETSGSITNYERYMDTAYRFMKQFNYPAVKTGYVGKIIPRGEHHDGQWMVNHYNRVAEKTASYNLMVNMHESTRPTGRHRTYPNWLACEAARGTEFLAWSEGNKPEHETILPFTRLMGGPMDYTPGIFNMKLNYADSTKKEQMHSTLAKQLALYITMYSPFQMAADLPEHYEQKADAFQFIKDVAVDWDKTVYVEAMPGDYITIARKAKNTPNWFAGSIADENKRTSILPLDFLDNDKTYEATIYMDAKDADWQNHMERYQIKKITVSQNSTLQIAVAPGGGYAISIKPVSNKKISTKKKLIKL